MSKYDTIIWDLDGTLLDSFGLYVEIMEEVLPKHGFVLPELSVIEKNYHGSLADTINHTLGGNLSKKLIEQIITDFTEVQHDHYELVDHHFYPDAAWLVAQAGSLGLRQMVVSNRDHTNRRNASPRSIIERSKLAGYIDTVICGDDSEHRKPKAAVIDGYQSSIGNALVIGDQFVDAEFAHNINADSVIVRRDGSEIPHIEQLEIGIHEKIVKVANLKDVQTMIS